MTHALSTVLDVANITPVLADIGSSGARRPIWEPIASRSILLAFDPDDREPSTDLVGAYRDVRMVPKAVTPDADLKEVEFVLTRYPHSSSTLEPDLDALSAFSFRDYFEPVDRVRVPAVTLSEVKEIADVSHIDWLKLDSQGIDLRLLQSMPVDMLDAMLAVEVEPGFVDAYLGEDLFPEVHAWLKGQGYWLADLMCQRYARISPDSLDALALEATKLGLPPSPLNVLAKSPTAAEASYLRPCGAAQSERQLVLGFVFGLMQGLVGHAYECLRLVRAKGTNQALEAAMIGAVQAKNADIRGDVGIRDAQGRGPLLRRRMARILRAVARRLDGG